MMNCDETYRVARQYLGQGGARFRRFCGLPSGAAWCNAFVDYVFYESGNKSLFFNGGKPTYCPTSMKWCSKNLAQIPIYLALPMDIIYFDWEPNGVPNHIGFVRERKSDQEVYTIEGNTSGGIVAEKLRTEKYVCGCYRPHYKPDKFSKDKALEVDGYFGYNSIAMLQKALGITQDGILGLVTVEQLQKKAKVTADGSWGVKTSRAVQKMIGAKVDGAFGPKSVKALQRWINAHNGYGKGSKDKQPEKAETWADKANKWAVEAAKKGFHYVVYNSGAKAHECPICHDHAKGAFYGWNCIGFAFAIWHHGGKLGNKCNCGVIDNATWDKLLKQMDSAAEALASNRIGIPVDVIKNGGKAIPLSKLKKGDICCLYNGGTALHIIYYMGDGRYADCGRGQTPQIQAGKALSDSAKAKIKLAIRPKQK